MFCEAEKSENKVELIVSLIKHETFYASDPTVSSYLEKKSSLSSAFSRSVDQENFAKI